MVAAAETAEVVAVGRALGVRDDVVEVGPRDRLAAAGMAAGAIAGLPEAALRRGGAVPVGRRRPVENRTPTTAVRGGSTSLRRD
jgi:hypothetical protein